MKNDPNQLITVCDKCLCASCWHGEFMCWDSDIAGTIERTRSNLNKLGNEHPDNYSDKKLADIQA